IKRDAASAASHFSAATFTYWDRLLPIARSGSKAQILSLPPSERYDVVAMRHRCTAAELKTLTGPFWLKLAMERGEYLGDEMTELGSIKVRGDFAEAQVLWEGDRLVDQNNKPVLVLFVKEQGGWKFDLPHNDKYANYWIEWGAKMERRDLNDYLLDMEEDSTGKRPRGDIYDRPN
ncbi:MAG: hypothetical protein ACOYN0_14945, partial [Phycisphaerales bacterium]